MNARATRLTHNNARYRWIGERTHGQTKRLIARAKLLVVSSKIEGGASVISEALVSNTPVLATRISGNVGMLGKNFSGLFSEGNANQLRQLLHRSETEQSFYRQLKNECRTLSKKFRPAREKATWNRTLSQMFNPIP